MLLLIYELFIRMRVMRRIGDGQKRFNKKADFVVEMSILEV